MRLRSFLIPIMTSLVIMGLSLAMLWIFSTQGQAAESVERFDKVGAPDAGTIYYVSKSGSGTDGLSWATAFTTLQDALAVAVSGDEIWAEKGVYYPDEGGGQLDNSVFATFALANGVSIYGGFNSGDTQLSDRNWVNNVTVLSGDVDGNDSTDANKVVTTPGDISGNNSYHVVSASGVDNSAVLDGFIITAGQANGVPPYNVGGGFYCYGGGSAAICNPTLMNLIFIGNLAQNFNVADQDNGGAMYNNGSGGESSPILHHVTFSNNLADLDGGAMYNDGSNGGESSPSLTYVFFYYNEAEKGGGGAMYNDAEAIGLSSPTMTNVAFYGNKSKLSGGALYNYGWNGISSPKLFGALFSGNSAGSDGGGMFNYGASNGISSPKLNNVTFSGNLAKQFGGGMFNKETLDGASNPEVRNGIFWDNQDNSGKGTLAANIYNADAKTVIRYTDLQASGGSAAWAGDASYINGGNNIDLDPKFITPVDPALAPTSVGNLRLAGDSPAIDAGENSYITGVPTDLDQYGRIADGNGDGVVTVDMGPYEKPIDIYLPIIVK